MRRFVLVRDHDVGGVSGEGVVVWGVCWPDGTCSYRWNTRTRTTVTADSVDDVEAIHGHGGATRLVWLDTLEGAQIWAQVPAAPGEGGRGPIVIPAPGGMTADGRLIETKDRVDRPARPGGGP